MDSKIKVTLPNGMTVEGTQEQVTNVARSFGYRLGDDGIHHFSASLGKLVKISDMTETHLRNAILKREIARLEGLRSKDLTGFLHALRAGTNDVTTLAMVAELAKRYR